MSAASPDGGGGGAPSTAVAPMRNYHQYAWKQPEGTCWRGIYRWEDEEHEGWKAALEAFPYKVRGEMVGWCLGARPHSNRTDL